MGYVPQSEDLAGMGLEQGEVFVTGGIARPEYCLILVTKSGNVKRVAINDLRDSEGEWQAVIGLASKNDEVVCAEVGPVETQVMLFTAKGKAIRFESGQVNPQATPSARGVKAITLREGDKLVAGAVFDPAQASHVIILSETGYLKQTPLNEFSIHKRGGQGVQSLAVKKQTGPVALATMGNGTGPVDLITAGGRRQRLNAKQIPEVNRGKPGRLLGQFKPGESVSHVVSLHIL
ncbi:MAG: hypothetical protein GY807_20815 [Gammaproteobacteria bacterium]|nr:hypothetical protein [Gammaproteobacteria bacterium]